jgi:MOSC domain-containing protein YiiM
MKLAPTSPIQLLLDTLPQQGTVQWIGVRPARKAPVHRVSQVQAITEQGLAGDHYAAKAGSKRQVTLIQQEHIDAITSLLHRDDLSPELLRRNVVVNGLNLLALKDRQFWIGDTLLEYTGLCHPCSRMEETLGPGGYNAVRGHGGITARIVQGGNIKVGDVVKVK